LLSLGVVKVARTKTRGSKVADPSPRASRKG
jgi:hypothetical protein